MSSNSILDSYQCNQCKERHTNLKKAKSCRAQCFKNHHRRHNDIQTSQTTLVPGQVSVVLNTVSNDTIEERADAIKDQIMDTLNSEDNDDPIMNIFSNDDNDESMYDAELGNDMDIIENETSPLVFDFSQPAPTPDKDDAKNLEFLKIIKDFGIFRNAHEMIVKHFNSILETSTCITYRACTSHLSKKLLKRFSGVEETTECSNCGQSRYKTRRGETEGGDLVATATMIQLPLARQLALALANEDTRADIHYRHNHESSSDGSKTDVFDGQVYQQAKHLFSGKDDIAISLSVDGFMPHNVPGSVTILHATILNLNPMVRYERSRILQIAMIPDPGAPANFWSFMEPTMKELLVLESKGMVIKTPNETISAKVHVLMVTGDILALAKLACHSGHMSKDGCRICHVVGQCPKHGQYFRTLPSTNIHTLESFQNFSQASASSRKGLNGQSPLATLKVFSGPLFFALDEMHGLCHGISKQVWGLVSGTYGTDHCFALSSGVWKEIGTAMYKTRNTIPTSFHGDWRDVYKNPGSFKAVDWADFLLFVVPTLVAECIGDATARNALLGLVQACNLLMSWELSAEEQTSIKSKLEIWNMYLESLLTSGKIKINIFTINQHLLQHYPLTIDAYGPPHAYSARSVERAISEYSRAIKNSTAGWPLTDEGERVGAGSDIEFWGPLRNRTIRDSFEGISCLSKLLEDFYESKGKECSMIEAAIQTSHKAFVNGCVIDSALDQNCVREAHNIRLQIQVDENRNINSAYSPVYKDFFGKVVVFFEHKLNNKRWPLALVEIVAVRLVNGIPVINNGQMKPKVVHLADVKELVGLVKSDATINTTTTTTTTTYIVWSELNRGPKLSLGSLADL
ncbi:hypothetical protein PHYBLDRAFT_151882 [Phycomyces blakesleeanus NRRL 1555(-)]|uniref:Uncharacterized protein n=1 Tax=Phycomyces blakesleeanus (strain ATCC 8743b / DSM 1359 / FGSC 10004 / NBRC 33097 / NRRL 1555) TaxID=763407 RepID=A0A162N8X7_PHYB8|nr:hypothetical protein PHYBLDRAFT_151882 [Phycomyces blakesleeanus NRRL 1555(-)]OAD66944.1 hypothetical protein PHYBLDRAFT_151882 [Phycomyces blakesleeanus NRRL 1555(-)]|eukprot:XP_018284984.1 hypothetical protein PHYBLDRAFT_151882 [Phycomyces blakesleeanus NRRL 1555(-)]